MGNTGKSHCHCATKFQHLWSLTQFMLLKYARFYRGWRLWGWPTIWPRHWFSLSKPALLNLWAHWWPGLTHWCMVSSHLLEILCMRVYMPPANQGRRRLVLLLFLPYPFLLLFIKPLLTEYSIDPVFGQAPLLLKVFLSNQDSLSRHSCHTWSGLCSIPDAACSTWWMCPQIPEVRFRASESAHLGKIWHSERWTKVAAQRQVKSWVHRKVRPR